MSLLWSTECWRANLQAGWCFAAPHFFTATVDLTPKIHAKAHYSIRLAAVKGMAKKEPWLSLGLQNQKNVLTLLQSGFSFVSRDDDW